MSITDEIMVSVIMPVYNHEEFLEQAIQSVLMQEVNFKYELLIGEDKSTDHSLDIIRKYERENSEIIEVIARKENIGGVKNSQDLRIRALGKYMIHLEGDDFWTEPKKLQKQVDFLENHPDYIACAHRFHTVNREGKIYSDRDFESIFFQDNDYSQEIFEKGMYLSHINTLMFRNIFRNPSIPTDFWLDFHHMAADYTIHALLILNGKMYCMKDYMSCYRKIIDNDSFSFSALQQRENRRDYLFLSITELEKILNQYYTVTFIHRKKSVFASAVMQWYRKKTKENFIVIYHIVSWSKQPVKYTRWFLYLIFCRFWKNLTGRRNERINF